MDCILAVVVEAH